VAFICKTISAVFKNVGVFVLAIYDFIIFIPLFIQRRMQQGRGEASDEPAAPRQREPRQKGKKVTSRDDEDDDAFILSDPAPEKAPNRDKQRQPEQKLEKAS
jgi:hypothetical protein